MESHLWLTPISSGLTDLVHELEQTINAPSPHNIPAFSMDAEPWSLIISCLKRQTLPEYFNMASIIMLIYDHILTLDLEVTLVWPAPWSVAKALYIMVAYMGLSESLVVFGSYNAYHTSSCTGWRKADTMLLACLMILGEAALIFRTWAIFGKRKTTGIVAFVSYAATVVTVLWLMVQSLEQVEFIPNPNPGRERCILIRDESLIRFLVMILFSCIELVIVAITMYHGVKHFRMSSSNLVVTFYRDGMLDYIYMLGFSVFNITTMVSGVIILAYMQAMLHAILIKRILLNLRVASSRDLANHIATNPPTTTLWFSTGVYNIGNNTRALNEEW
ncbi:hypothetical protein JB92DRAFT_3102474 [Gautieria morchelliformis]|nr:hypothetical protein JB92DRAFT_3102474 [Gautieria morchelliformis]